MSPPAQLSLDPFPCERWDLGTRLPQSMLEWKYVNHHLNSAPFLLFLLPPNPTVSLSLSPGRKLPPENMTQFTGGQSLLKQLPQEDKKRCSACGNGWPWSTAVLCETDQCFVVQYVQVSMIKLSAVCCLLWRYIQPIQVGQEHMMTSLSSCALEVEGVGLLIKQGCLAAQEVVACVEWGQKWSSWCSRSRKGQACVSTCLE